MSNVPAVPVSGPRLRAGQGALRMSGRSAMDGLYATAEARFYPVRSGRARSIAREVDVYIATLLLRALLVQIESLGPRAGGPSRRLSVGVHRHVGCRSRLRRR
jgi:hypothetical protein